MGQLVYLAFSGSNLRIANGLRRGYWNHLYNYADNKPVLDRDRTGLGSIMDLIQEALADKTPDEVNNMSLGKILGLLCATQDCKKSLDKNSALFSVWLTADCDGIISDLTHLKGGPSWVGLVQGAAGGVQEMIDSCAENCEKTLKKAPQCCNGGK